MPRPKVSVAVDRELLKKMRKEKGISQEELGLKTGYTQGRIAQFEGGGVPLKALKKIAEIFEVDYRIFLI